MEKSPKSKVQIGMKRLGPTWGTIINTKVSLGSDKDSFIRSQLRVDLRTKTDLFAEQHTRDLKKDVRDEKEGESSVVVVALHAQVGFEASQSLPELRENKIPDLLRRIHTAFPLQKDEHY